MIEDEVITPSSPTNFVPTSDTPKPYLDRRVKIAMLIILPLIAVATFLLLRRRTRFTKPSGTAPTTTIATPLPTQPLELNLKYPFATNSALLDIEASVSGTIDPNINQLLYLLQLPDINHPINFKI